jgi:hypothetical protein
MQLDTSYYILNSSVTFYELHADTKYFTRDMGTNVRKSKVLVVVVVVVAVATIIVAVVVMAVIVI